MLFRSLVGLSLDGSSAIHDKYRRNGAGGGSHAAVLRGMDRLKRHNVAFNTLTLVNEANVTKPEEVYGYLCDNGSLHHQYIPCVEPDENRDVLPFSTSDKEWGEFLCRLFDVWYPSDTRRVSIRLFDAILALLVDNVRNVCHFGMDCRQYFVVEYNGDVFPCDFFVEKRLKLGTILENSWTMMQQSPIYAHFGGQKRKWNDRCNSCEFLEICAGDCLKHRLCTGGGDPRRLSLLCEGWKMFYSHTLPRFKKLAAQVRQDRQRMAMQSNPVSVGRNDPCPCGSGRKYKKCCGRQDG